MAKIIVHVPLSSRALGIVGEAVRLSNLNGSELHFISTEKDKSRARTAIEAVLRSHQYNAGETEISLLNGIPCDTLTKVATQHDCSTVVASLYDIMDPVPLMECSSLLRNMRLISCPFILFPNPVVRGTRFRTISALIKLEETSLPVVEIALELHAAYHSRALHLAVLSPSKRDETYACWHSAQSYAVDQFLDAFDLDHVRVEKDFHHENSPLSINLLTRHKSDMLILSSLQFAHAVPLISALEIPLLVIPVNLQTSAKSLFSKQGR